MPRAWGENLSGQLGDGTTQPRSTPVALAIDQVSALAAGSLHSLALQSDGRVLAWGDNGDGQLGDGTTTAHLDPEPVPDLQDIVAIAAGDGHSLALHQDGSVFSWGRNSSGQLGDGTLQPRTSPVRIDLAEIVAIAAGADFSLALNAHGDLFAWGDNGRGQLGIGSTSGQDRPVQVDLRDIVDIAAGDTHALALRREGAGPQHTFTVFAWGSNDHGQLGDGTTTQQSLPVEVRGLAGEPDLAGVEAGAFHSLALRADGVLLAWGRNDDGQLGDGTTTQQPVPVEVQASSALVAAEGGLEHTLAITDQGQVLAWGSNDRGQLGTGGGSSLEPADIRGLEASAVAAGDLHSLAVQAVELD